MDNSARVEGYVTFGGGAEERIRGRKTGSCYIAGFEDEGRAHEPRDTGGLWGWKSLGNELYSKISRGNTLLLTF